MCPISVGGMYSVGPWIIHLSPGVRWTLSPAERRRENTSSQHTRYHTTSHMCHTTNFSCCHRLLLHKHFTIPSLPHVDHTHTQISQLKNTLLCAIPSSDTYTSKSPTRSLKSQSAACISSLVTLCSASLVPRCAPHSLHSSPQPKD